MPQALHIAAATDANLALALKVLPALVVILAASALCGRLAILVKQPRVLGEMVAGVLLGPTLFGALFPTAQQAIFSADVKPILYVLSTIGLTLFMFLVGAGFDHGEGKGMKETRNAGVLALSGILPSVALGFGVGYLLYDHLSRTDVSAFEFSLFLGGALSITAFPMLARILYERRLQNTGLGRMTLLGASIDDAAAWCFLAVLSAMHVEAGGLHALRTIGLSLLFAVIMLFGVSRLLRPLGARVQRTGHFGFDQMYVVMGVALLAGFFTDYIGIYSVFGGFIAGLAMPKNPAFRKALHEKLMDSVCVLLLPIFFAFSGLNTRLDGIAGWAMIGPFLLILLVSFVGKYFGCGLALRCIGMSWRKSFAVGGLMNARGLMILIFINVGLAQGMITQEVFSMLVLVAVATTAAAMPLYRWALPAHMEREMLMSDSDSEASEGKPSQTEAELVSTPR
ncbi:transporter [Streptomyces sp. CAI-21]|uniref:cation:proton antiporter n=2 Tax=Streptomyces TaxID=1883 RepID=UPI00096B1BB2|nr:MULTISPECIES: cation:proton antiporter [Streptomyces]MBO1287099.1 cation:proton antiporter [Streptomyces sampsonii]NUW09489.1 transporter [Streptomyces sp. CAI-21]NVI30964.1 transporter [Streptomyces sp. CAI-17]